ncbi:hypothetical protein D5F01_LYC06897 [Larimichthys crocea]|uniref:Uncharacterized protein n=1 Tax=Larimichthys crocea TaxID=215358 RepID=A0A6G0IQZ9_LARCR|nr:hypothetical protein D5F01_LYC06897 [Larimichthys crocea]
MRCHSPHKSYPFTAFRGDNKPNQFKRQWQKIPRQSGAPASVTVVKTSILVAMVSGAALALPVQFQGALERTVVSHYLAFGTDIISRVPYVMTSPLAVSASGAPGVRLIGSLCNDIATTCACVWCSWCQVHRELKYRKKNAKIINVQPVKGTHQDPPPAGFVS